MELFFLLMMLPFFLVSQIWTWNNSFFPSSICNQLPGSCVVPCNAFRVSYICIPTAAILVQTSISATLVCIYIFPYAVFLSFQDIDIFEEYKPVILHSLAQFGFVCCFITIKLRLHTFGKGANMRGAVFFLLDASYQKACVSLVETLWSLVFPRFPSMKLLFCPL